MSKKLFMLLVMAMLLFLLPVVFLAKIAEATEETGVGLIDYGACGEMRYDFYDEYKNYIFFQADRSVQYRLYKDGTMVISGNGEMGDFDTWNEGCSWYRMKDQMPWYYCRAKIKKLVVEEGVTSIGSAAFYGCKNLESIQWADSIEKVGDSAFYKCSSLKEVKLPSYVKEWGKFVFAECKGLKKAFMDEDFGFYVEYAEEGDLEYVNELTPTISYSDGIGMFSGCTSLEEVKLPKDILAIPSRFVEGCTSLKTFPIPDNVNFWGSFPPSLCKGKYILPDSVRMLESGGFAGCSDLEELILPEGLVYIGTAFEGCSSLKTLKIPKSVRNLYKTFYNCTGLESIVIPDTVQEYDARVYGIEGTFEGCSNLKSVVLPKDMKFIGTNFFKNCTSLKKINLPPKLTGIGYCTFEGCSSLTEIKIPKTVNEIRRCAFSGCTSLEEIDIPKGVDVLYSETFCNCKNLKRVTMRAKSFEFYGIKIFYGCKKLSEITLYAETIGHGYDGAFDGIPKGVTIYVPKGYVNKIKKQFKIAKIDMSKIDIKPMQ